MNPFAKPILRAAESEGGGGGGNDRTAALEARLDKLTTTFDNFLANVANQQKSSEDAAAAEVERRVSASLKAAEAAVDTAQDELAKAFDDGDGKTIAAAQRKLNEATVERERVRQDEANVKAAIAERQRQAEKKQKGGGEKLDTTNLNQWKADNKTWYGIDTEMTAEAHAADAQIRKAGVIAPGSPEYFDAVNRHMAAKYPDKFKGSPAGQGMNGNGNGSGERERQTANGTRIPASIADGYRRMGIDIDTPEVAQRMVKHRETAVAKGLLPAEPVIARVRA